MLTIYADNKLMHAPHLCEEGCGVFSPKLTLELNKAGSLEYTLPPSNILYDRVQKLKSVITVNQNGEELFRGRVLHDDRNFYKQKKTYCEGELAYLLDSKQRPYTFYGTAGDLFRQYISNHNSRVEANKRFTVGNITVSSVNEKVSCSNNNYPTTFDEITDQLLNSFGGYLWIRARGDTRYIDWLSGEETSTVHTQTIEFGKNLLDISEYITAEDIFTVLIPLGASVGSGDTSSKLNIASVNGGKDYLENESAIALFGRIEHTEDWSDVKDASSLKNLGEELLSRNIELAMTLTVKAVDLNILDVDVERIHLGDWVRVISLPHGLDKAFQCTKIVYDFNSPDQNEYVFGLTITSLTEQQLRDKKNIQGSMSTVATAVEAANVSANKANEAAANAEKVVASTSTAMNDKVSKSGDTMTGKLFLSGNPTEDLEAATKKYVDVNRVPEDLGRRIDTLETQMSDLLYTPISISSFSHNVGTKERGDKVTSVNLTWSLNKTPETLKLDGETLAVSARSKSISGLNITADSSTWPKWTLTATDERDKVVSKTTSGFTFLNCVYYGMAELPEAIDSAFIRSLGTKTSPTSTRALSFTVAGDGTYIWYCLPTGLGKCTFVSAGFPAAFTLVDTIAFTNALGYTENYYVYRSDERINKTIPIGVS